MSGLDSRPSQPSGPDNGRRIAGFAAGALITTAIYGGEVGIAYAVLDTIRAGFQSPEPLSSGVSALCALGLLVVCLNDIFAHRGETTRWLLSSGIVAGQAVNQAIVEG